MKVHSITIEPISDERLAEIRAGLEGVSKGPWSVYADDCAQCRKFGRLEANILGLPGGMHAQFDNLRDAEHVARLDPQTVAAILARLDKAEADAATARGLLSSLLNGDGPAVVPSPHPTA